MHQGVIVQRLRPSHWFETMVWNLLFRLAVKRLEALSSWFLKVFPQSPRSQLKQITFSVRLWTKKHGKTSVLLEWQLYTKLCLERSISVKWIEKRTVAYCSLKQTDFDLLQDIFIIFLTWRRFDLAWRIWITASWITKVVSLIAFIFLVFVVLH